MNETPRDPMEVIREEAKAKYNKANTNGENHDNGSHNIIVAKPYIYRDPNSFRRANSCMPDIIFAGFSQQQSPLAALARPACSLSKPLAWQSVEICSRE
jgi:hypothetical protein